jgi:hypothetical protein
VDRQGQVIRGQSAWSLSLPDDNQGKFPSVCVNGNNSRQSLLLVVINLNLDYLGVCVRPSHERARHSFSVSLVNIHDPITGILAHELVHFCDEPSIFSLVAVGLRLNDGPLSESRFRDRNA